MNNIHRNDAPNNVSPQLPREEGLIFADLETLCREAGFVHAIARMCLRDNMISLQGEATPEDMLKCYDWSRLARNEMNVLIGLWVKGAMDFTEPAAETIEVYISQSRKLMEEIHSSMNVPMMMAMRDLVCGDKREPTPSSAASDLFGGGASMREAIFYGGESAFAFQYRDFAPMRYGADNDWIVAKMRFSIKEVAIVARAVAQIIDEQASLAMTKAQGDFEKIARPLDIFTLSTERVASTAKLPLETCERILHAFSYQEGDGNSAFDKVDARNIAAIRPLLRRDNRFILFNSVDFYEVIYQAPYFWMLDDKAYQPMASTNRGVFTEEFAARRLAAVFEPARTFLNVKMMRRSEVAGEIDVLVVFSSLAIVVQAKSKQLTAAARQGNEKQIQKDFSGAVQDACDQGMDCAKMLLNPSIRLEDAEGKPLEKPDVKKVFVICLVADHYPALAAQVRQFLKFDAFPNVAPPIVMDVFLLDAMAEMLDSPLHFLNYLDRRCSYADRLMASHELNILGFHLKRNLWMEEEASLFHLLDDFAIDLELSMLARREGLPAPWTPPGILTMLEGTTLSKIVKSIERRPDPGMAELGFSILGMSGDASKQASDAIDEMSRRARLDGRPHDFTMQMEGGVGFTFHSSPWSDEAARAYLVEHCIKRKYVSRASRWFGVVVNPANGNMRFGAMFDFPWAEDRELASTTAHMTRKSNISRPELRSLARSQNQPKVGRNDSCPCGSGKKWKRCCAP